MIKQGLEIKQTQKLSPLQIQTIKLTELPIQDLMQRIRSELEENPVLDDTQPNSSEGEQQNKDISIDDIKDDSIPTYNLYVNNWGKDPRPEYNTFSVKTNFTQGLMEQLGFRSLSSREYDIAAFIIGSLDSDGYLRRDIESIVDDLAFRANINTDAEEVQAMLKVVQDFEPAGVGARDLRECLLLQLKTLRPSPDVTNAIRIVSDFFQEFSNRHFQKIMVRMDIDESELKRATARILKLNPSPGGDYEESYVERAQQVIPDFVLTEEDGQISFTMPRFVIPELRINKKYAEMLAGANENDPKEQRDAVSFVKQKIDSAKWFVEALKQRQNTLSRTMSAIIEYQNEYFDTGNETRLKPMVLKDIAERTGFDISTISRVVNRKYIETPFGVFPLKYFFSEGMENKNGEEVSTRELKKALQECVDSENKKRPLTDEQLVVEMGKKGYKVARRTIAKYRSQLGIPLARWRKEL